MLTTGEKMVRFKVKFGCIVTERQQVNKIMRGNKIQTHRNPMGSVMGEQKGRPEETAGLNMS